MRIALRPVVKGSGEFAPSIMVTIEFDAYAARGVNVMYDGDPMRCGGALPCRLGNIVGDDYAWKFTFTARRKSAQILRFGHGRSIRP